MTPNLWIVVVTFNGLDDTRKCLQSIETIRFPAVRTVVVDNASTDGTAGCLRREFPWCDLIESPLNAGFTGGNNLGICHALERGADWVVLLNNDTLVRPEFCARLAEAAGAHPEFGVIGPVINYMDEPDVVMVDGFAFNEAGCPAFFRPAGVALGRTDPPQLTDVDVVDGCCMMIAAPLVRAIGAFDQRFFIYHEVVDFCLRARRAGFRCGMLREQLVWHKGSSSFQRTGKQLPRYYDARNLGLVLWKHRGARQHGRPALISMLIYLRYVYWRYAAEREGGHQRAADAVLDGFCDALTGCYGPFVARRRPWRRPLSLLFELGRRRPRLA